MTALAPATAGTTSEKDEGIRSEDLPGDANNASSQDSDRMRFSGDGINTGVRVLSA